MKKKKDLRGKKMERRWSPIEQSLLKVKYKISFSLNNPNVVQLEHEVDISVVEITINVPRIFIGLFLESSKKI